MEALERNRKALKWMWGRLHRGNLKMPPDRLIFEGEHDLLYLYNTGFVDTECVTPDQWILAFRESRQKDGSYNLTEEQWLDKAKYRYSGSVEAPFDPMTIREGEWAEDKWKQLIKDKFLPETTINYDLFVYGIEQAKKKGEIKNNIVILTSEKKTNITKLLNKYPSPRRCRALSLERIRQHDALDGSEEGVAPQALSSQPSAQQHEATKFAPSPDKQKTAAGSLTDLLKGSKK